MLTKYDIGRKVKINWDNIKGLSEQAMDVLKQFDASFKNIHIITDVFIRQNSYNRIELDKLFVFYENEVELIG